MIGWSGEITARVGSEIRHGVPCRTYAPRPKNISAMLAESARRYPAHSAFIEGERHTSYAEFSQRVAALACRIGYAGIRCGDRVAVICQNTHVFCVAVFAALRVGAVVVPVSSKFNPQEVRVILASARPDLIITENPEWRNELGGDGVPVWLMQSLEEMEQGEPARYELPDIDAVDDSETAFLMHTSGTTGRPKGAQLTHANVIHGALNYQLCYGVGHDDTTVIAAPIFHGTGLMAQLMPLVGAGGTSVLLPRFSAKKTLELIAEKGVTYFIAPPTIYAMLLRERDQASDYSSLKKLVVGGAPLPATLHAAMREWLPQAFFVNTYGLTEATSPALMTPPDWIERLNGTSVGIASPCMEAKVVDPKTGEDLPAGEAGELLLRGALVCNGYWENPAATAKAFADGWLRTGDLATMDASGCIAIHDRLKDMINRGGEKIYSIEVEDVIQSHPDVVEVAVVPAPDALYGERVRAVVVKKPGSALSATDVMQWVGARLAKYKTPEIVDFINILPRNASGKVVKPAL